MGHCLDCGCKLTGHGKPERCRSCARQGERHPLWKGTDIEYYAAHHRVKRVRGRASDHSCACGKTARQWSYDHNDPDERTSRKPRTLGMKFSLDTSHYVPRCVACHQEDDGWGFQPGNYMGA